MRFGAHVSIAKHLYEAIDRAVEVGCDAMQIFPGSPRSWRPSQFSPEDILEFKRRRERAGIRPLAIHLPYLANLSSPVDRIVEASEHAVIDALDKAKAMEADFLVLHIGSHGGAGRERGLARIETSIRRLLQEDFGPVRLLLENTSGAGDALGSTVADLAAIMAPTGFDPRLGLCLDTCHAYGAGYDIAHSRGLDEFLSEISERLGAGRLMLVHANDSRGALGSRLDRHQHIGQGHIGLDGFRTILHHPALQDLAFIIETPHPGMQHDPSNIRVLRNLAGTSLTS